MLALWRSGDTSTMYTYDRVSVKVLSTTFIIHVSQNSVNARLVTVWL